MIAWSQIFGHAREEFDFQHRCTLAVIVMIPGAFFAANITEAPNNLSGIVFDESIRNPLIDHIIAMDGTLNAFPKDISWDDAIILEQVLFFFL